MSKEIKAVLLDLDGTLVHYETEYVVSEVKRVATALDLPKPAETHIRSCVARGAIDKVLPKTVKVDFESYFWQMFNERPSRPLSLLPRVEQTLQHLTAQGLKLALVTARNSEEMDLAKHLESAGIRGFFSTIVTKRRLLQPWAGKESYFLSALRDLHLTADQVAAVGDRPSDAQSATTVGVSLNILVRTGGIKESVLRDTNCHHIVDDVSHLPSLLFGTSL